MKALFPDRDGPGLTAVVLNTAGGITGGDRLALSAQAGAGSRLTLTTQAAERLYAALPGETGHVANRLRLEAGARLDWLPQETILFDRAAIRRSMEIEMAADAPLLLVEPLILGRPAMGEVVRQAAFLDAIRLTRAGVLTYADGLRLVGDASSTLLARPATGAGAGAAALILYAAPDAHRFLAPLGRCCPTPPAPA